jgi:hypothetical protein
MKKITVILILFSICTLAGAQGKEKLKKEKDVEQAAFYIYSPGVDLVLEAGTIPGNASSALRFNKLQTGNNNQLFVMDKYADDWNLIYNLQTKEYLTINGNQIGLGDRLNSERVRFYNGNFYVEYQGQVLKLMVNPYEAGRGPRGTPATRGSVSREGISRKSYPSLDIDISNRSPNKNSYFELYGPRQYAELLARTGNAATPPPPPPRATPSPSPRATPSPSPQAIPAPPPAKPATGLVTIKLNSTTRCGSYFVVLENLENKDNSIEIWLDRDCEAVQEIPIGRYKVHFNLMYTDAGCDQCENPAKIKRVNTNCSTTTISLGKNQTANLSCYKDN